MPCFSCCCARKKSKQQEPILDLYQILSDAAWNGYTIQKSAWTNCFIKRSNYEFEIPENIFKFEQIGETQIPGMESTDIQTIENTRPNPHSIEVKTFLSNETDSDLTYNFRYQKERKSEVKISLQKGYKLGAKANFKIGLPLKGAEFGLEGTAEYSVTNTKEELFSNAITTESTSIIPVPHGKKYVASIKMDEKKIQSKFTATMRMSLLSDEAANVYIRRKSDKTLVATHPCKNLKDLFVKPNCDDVKEVKGSKGKEVDFVVKGVIEINLFNHRINLKKEEPGDGDTANIANAGQANVAPTE